jgi:hypothetical protein
MNSFQTLILKLPVDRTMPIFLAIRKANLHLWKFIRAQHRNSKITGRQIGYLQIHDKPS